MLFDDKPDWELRENNKFFGNVISNVNSIIDFHKP